MTTASDTSSEQRTFPWTRVVIGLVVVVIAAFFLWPEDHRRPSSDASITRNELTADTFGWVGDNIATIEEVDVGETMEQVSDRLNQWVRAGAPKVEWHETSLLASLPAELRDQPALKSLASLQFAPKDIAFMQHAVWLRDIAMHARGDALDDLAIAERLFDWSVRNIQLEPEEGAGAWPTVRSVGETLLVGRGTAAERARIFILLARQQGLHAYMLAFPGENENARPKEWAVGVRLADQSKNSQLYLFDARLGLPIRTLDGKRVATFAEVSADDNILRALDLSADERYPVKAADLAHVISLIEASPEELSKRMALVESLLSGERRVRLAVDADALAKELDQGAPGAVTRLWWLPYEAELARSRGGVELSTALALELAPFQLHERARVLADRVMERAVQELQRANQPVPQPTPRVDDFDSQSEGLASQTARGGKSDSRKKMGKVYMLRSGRLRQFRGDFTGPAGAKQRLMAALPSDDELNYFAEAIEVCKRVKLPEFQDRAVQMELVLAAYKKMRQPATLWLGMIVDEEMQLNTAATFLKQFTGGPLRSSAWASGARYNLARAYEANGQTDEAIKLYEDDKSPQRYGNRVRAKQLKETAAKKAP